MPWELSEYPPKWKAAVYAFVKIRLEEEKKAMKNMEK
ncbi:hypothetical protein ABOUO_18 [Brevibacillus phage Abouo]|uniref:Uncharacterized protein n=2 Tax=Abouovirus TaxID=1984773 RepID=S5MUW1_9CAUD|nr:hypothetical protein DAVIES_18 [Brevibacillus phage Davies]YP_009220075.1 hypothetical protein AVV45_gp18 [Brevibacillus phage Abouo]AGR47523.1 hypothetical protein ABOUO_18 [Brevibacillus phage Abouo]AGR47627.1 hypothetical protein DAVIES_18 [Brevibacillus phage Davies]